MRKTSFLLVGLVLASLMLPGALAAEGPEAGAMVNCGQGFVDALCRATFTLLCLVIDFLIGPGFCDNIA